MADAGPVRLREQMRRNASEAILTSAEALIAREGIGHASMQAIAREAGVAVGTLYNYFGGREGLLVQLVERQRRRVAASLEAARRATEGLGFEAQALAFLSGVIQLFDERRELVRAALGSELWRALALDGGSGGPPRVSEQLEARARALAALGVREGVLAPLGSSEWSGERLGAQLSGALQAVLAARAQARSSITPAEEAALSLRLFIHGAGIDLAQRRRAEGE